MASLLSLATPGGVTRRYGLLVGLQELAIWLPLPVLVMHMTDRGFELALIGVAFALRSILVVLLEIPTGGLADSIGRKPIALASQALTGLSFLVLLFVAGPAWLLAYAVLQGVGAALHSGALDAWYVDTLKRVDPAADLQERFASIGVVQAAAVLVGAGIGGSLPALAASWALPWPLAGFGIALAVGLALRVVVWFLTLALVHEPEYAGKMSMAGLRAVPEVFRDAVRLTRGSPVIGLLLVGALAGGIAMTTVETFWQPVAALSLGSSPEGTAVFGVFGMLIGAASIAGGLGVMRYGKYMPGGSAALAFASQLFKGVALVLLALQFTTPGLALGLMLVYFGISVRDAPHAALLNEAIPNERRSIMMSVNSLAFFGGLAIGSSALGWLATAADPRVAMAAGGVATAVASAAYVAIGVRQRKQALIAKRTVA